MHSAICTSFTGITSDKEGGEREGKKKKEEEERKAGACE